ncbi:nitroreductase family protein [uncultured Tenacibaculum sp.]|uniref:nitroreductase family protein n=1 Tax=uncultured Tenacibaculum sp. TaxID=174713 RepID=UPI00261AB52B|nr:nitroreductase family protein [uncultured Tenacibaculum sp.]
MSVIESLEWRAAIKKFDSEKKVEQEDLEQLLNAANLAATSGGLQPFKVIVVSEGELKSKLEPHGYGQEQFETASHILVFAVETNISDETVDTYASRAAEIRGKGKNDWLC